jgi:hypothetical protein
VLWQELRGWDHLTDGCDLLTNICAEEQVSNGLSLQQREDHVAEIVFFCRHTAETKLVRLLKTLSHTRGISPATVACNSPWLALTTS